MCMEETERASFVKYFDSVLEQTVGSVILQPIQHTTTEEDWPLATLANFTSGIHMLLAIKVT